MRHTTSLSFFLSVLLYSSLTTAVQDSTRNQDLDAVERRQLEPSPTTSSTIGYLPNAGLLSTGTPANGNVSLTGHGPAVQPQPGHSSSTGSGNDTMSGADDNTTTSGNDTNSGGSLEGNPVNSTTNDTSIPSSMNDTSATPETPTEEPPLVVSSTQYRVNGYQRVLLSLTYGESNITQLWEAHDGMLSVVPIPANETGGQGGEVSIDPVEMPTTTVHGGDPYIPTGTGDAGIGGAGNDTNSPAAARPTTTSMAYQVDAGVAGASGRPVAVVNLDKPDANHPGFVGPRAKLKAKRFLKGGEREEGVR